MICNASFVDVEGYECERYESDGLCTRDGNYGAVYDESFEDLAVNGQTAMAHGFFKLAKKLNPCFLSFFKLAKKN